MKPTGEYAKRLDYFKKYNEENREKILKRLREYKRKNKKRINAYNNAWAKNNKEKRRRLRKLCR
jgi:GrpB-like predicted nucleotidyltransferase (UPF0157 family)